ncbi:transcriptional regulator [Chryseobacterium sp. FH1]|uniref:transcriptional regulator n=1 Tax=Chryseobacterium sp. FH1 TaxID=1233951 RepID=UPI0004E3EDE7|nr:transcriptional regulator [Chryseobacterium sp. FH1]KFC19329.1 transcriptional regulator [Chryseobacterium sp. FH1]
MNYIKHLTGFFEKVADEKTLNPTHISLYIALFQFWNFNRFRNPISISRDEVMRISKISSKATYHKCLKNLHALGYIDYQPSYNPFRGSHVVMFDFAGELKPVPRQTRTKNELFSESVDEQDSNNPCSSDGTGTGQALVYSINSTNKTNNSNEINGVGAVQKFSEKENGEANENIPGEKKGPDRDRAFTQPELSEVHAYFQHQDCPGIEAEKFYNYFSSNGWLVGGKSKMKNWQAAARNWMLNSKKFNASPPVQSVTNNIRPSNLTASVNKSYQEKL